ncbi:hypothetical protein [Streptomyces collinus]|uniref:hypothetical protein n=1 Tax=Streptomyces collinus TaxID=42684 RepID=UPI002943BBED|nr:hypothetical protein [Streptomyces collinus]
MAHRPRPNRERAVRQVERHAFEVGSTLPAPRPAPFEQRLLDGTATVVTDVEPVATTLHQVAAAAREYRLSAR